MYHLRAKIIGRSLGRVVAGAVAYRSGSKVASAAISYRAGEKLVDPNTGKVFDYRAKGRIDKDGFGVLHAETLAPPNAPAWVYDRQALVDAVEAAEKRKDAQLFREIEVSFPRELKLEDQKALIRAYVERMFVREGMVAQIFIHNERASDGGENPHAHVLLSLREIGPDGFGKKVRAWNQPSLIRDWREAWADYANDFLRARGYEPRLDHRSHAERGLEVEPDIYVGPAGARGLDGIIVAHRQEERAAIKERNLEQARIKPAWVLQQITRTQSTFTERDVAKFVHRATALTAQDDRFTELMAKVMQSADMQKIADAGGQEPARYSTRQMLACEAEMERAAFKLAGRHSGSVTPRAMPGLSADQEAAARALLMAPDLVALHGLAGTGKTHLLAEVARQFAASGHRVRGAALSAIVARNLGEAVSGRSQTIASLLSELRRRPLEKGDALIIDEAGMVGSRQMGAILDHAETHGAKVILVGDTRQLQSIEAGGAFGRLVRTFGAAELTQIRRQRHEWQRQASADMANGKTAEALATYRAQGHFHAEATPEEAMERLIGKWFAERTQGQSQLILAHRRAEAQALNRVARRRLRQEGLLGRNVRIDVTISEDKAGEVVERQVGRDFASGDRLLFTRNDWALGVQNGTLATILALTPDGEFKVRCDDGRELTFNARDYSHLEQGYALTIHKAQGATVDRAYVLAGEMFDAHMAYVAMTRHRERVDLFYNRVDFPTDAKLMRTFQRENLKDTTLDYVVTVPPEADLPRLDPRLLSTSHWAEFARETRERGPRDLSAERDMGLGD